MTEYSTLRKMDPDFAQFSDHLQIHDDVSPEENIRSGLQQQKLFNPHLTSDPGAADEFKIPEAESADDPPKKILEKVLEELR